MCALADASRVESGVGSGAESGAESAVGERGGAVGAQVVGAAVRARDGRSGGADLLPLVRGGLLYNPLITKLRVKLEHSPSLVSFPRSFLL